MEVKGVLCLFFYFLMGLRHSTGARQRTLCLDLERGLSTQRCCLGVLPGPGLQGTWDECASLMGHLEPAVKATASVPPPSLLVQH